MTNKQRQVITQRIFESYGRFTPYFVQMLSGRNHFTKQADAVRRFLGRLKKQKIRVLDAACGTGDVLALLAHDQGLLFAGSDGSAQMLSIALQKETLVGMPLSHCPWAKLKALFDSLGGFDIVFILGNSIAHVASIEDLESTLKTIQRGLNPGGLVAFDFRQWDYDSAQKCLVEPGRSIGTERDFGQFRIDDRTVRITDTCNYKDRRQVISYKVTDCKKVSSKSAGVETFEFSYLPFVESKVLSMLSNIGLADPEILDLRPEYPYLIAHGTRR